MELADGRRALCVFSFEEARLFLRLAGCGGWRARASGIGISSPSCPVLAGRWSWSPWIRFRKGKPSW